MPSWLLDDPTTVLFVLALLALALGVLWWVRRGDDYGKKKLSWIKALKARRLTLNQCCAMGLTLIGFLAAVILLLYFFVDTPNKRIERAIREMARGVREQNVDRVFAHVSDRFTLMGQGKESYRGVVARYFQNGTITDISAWDLEEARLTEDKREATIQFKVKPKGTMTSGVGYRCEARFVRDPDGQWRLQTFRVFMPQDDPSKKAQVIYPPP
jgi:ketosteroid isomerase-like protein